MTTLYDLIDQAMKFVLTGDTAVLSDLREQYKNSVVSNIEKSPVGCFVNFSINNNTKKANIKNAYIGDVFLESKQIPLGMGVILFIEDGFISMLEFYTYGDDVLPDVFVDYRFVYGNGERNFNSYLS